MLWPLMISNGWLRGGGKLMEANLATAPLTFRSLSWASEREYGEAVWPTFSIQTAAEGRCGGGGGELGLTVADVHLNLQDAHISSDGRQDSPFESVEMGFSLMTQKLYLCSPYRRTWPLPARASRRSERTWAEPTSYRL